MTQRTNRDYLPDGFESVGIVHVLEDPAWTGEVLSPHISDNDEIAVAKPVLPGSPPKFQRVQVPLRLVRWIR